MTFGKMELIIVKEQHHAEVPEFFLKTRDSFSSWRRADSRLKPKMSCCRAIVRSARNNESVFLQMSIDCSVSKRARLRYDWWQRSSCWLNLRS